MNKASKWITIIIMLAGLCFSAFSWVGSNFVNKDAFSQLMYRIDDMGKKIDLIYDFQLRGKK